MQALAFDCIVLRLAPYTDAIRGPKGFKQRFRSGLD